MVARKNQTRILQTGRYHWIGNTRLARRVAPLLEMSQTRYASIVDARAEQADEHNEKQGNVGDENGNHVKMLSVISFVWMLTTSQVARI